MAMEHKEPLSQYGVGPFYAGTVLLLTLAAPRLEQADLLPVLRVSSAELPLKFLAAALLWANAEKGCLVLS